MVSSTNDNRHIQHRIRVQIPKTYHQEPIISDLITHYGVTVNITAALLSANAKEDGWFDLELRGTVNQVHSALEYLHDLNLKTWHGDNDPEDGW
jgi:ABC-type methionine transport system ATPase subunit